MKVCFAVTWLLVTVASTVEAFVPTQVAVAPRVEAYQRHTTDLKMLDPSQFLDQVVSAATSLVVASNDVDMGPPEAGGVSYSRASYYTILGLYLLSFPGLWSTIKRSTKAKVKRKTFVSKGEKASTGNGKSLREEAGGIMACKKEITSTSF